jgi:RNA polymerase sigma factor (sigma-70 family)
VRLTETDRVYEELLLVLVRSGDRDAAERLAARWQPRLIRTARRLLQDEEQAREAVQEAWAGIARGWGRMADPARFPAWAFSILHRRCADRIRAEAFEPTPSRLCNWCDWRAECPAFEGDGPDVPGTALVELKRLQRRRARDEARIAELEEIVRSRLGDEALVEVLERDG